MIRIDRQGGLLWADDGRERMAGAVEERLHRFFRNGIAARRNKLMGRYLKGLVPINPGATVINFGANIGELAVTFANLGATVLAIEPDPHVIPALRANAHGRSIEVIPEASWNTDGTLDMFIATEGADTSAINPSPDKQQVVCHRLDTLVEARGIERISLLIGDAEGAEPEVLQGASGILEKTDYVSVCASKERRGEKTLEACEELLKAANFEIIYRAENGLPLIGKRRVRAVDGVVFAF